MPITTVMKSKPTKTCVGCGGNVAMDAKTCQNCGGSNLKKVLIVIRKSESVADVPGQEPPDIPVPEVEDDDIEAEDEEDLEDDDLEDEDEEDETDDEEEEADDVKKTISKGILPTVANEIAHMAITLANSLIAASEGPNAIVKIDEELTIFNNVLDAAAEEWADGNTVSKALDPAMRAKLQAKLKMLKQKAADMAEDATDGGADEDEEDGKMSKSDKGNTDIYKGLHPEIAAKIKLADELVEKAAVDKYESIAKSLGRVGDDVSETGKMLRFLSENNTEAYDTVVKQLKAAAEQEKESSVFKSFGSQGAGAMGGDKVEALAKSYQAIDAKLTKEQAVAKAYAENPGLYDEALAV